MGRPKQLNPCCEVIVDPPDPPITDCSNAICIAFIDENDRNGETTEQRIAKIEGFATAFPDRLLFVLDVYRAPSSQTEVTFPSTFYNQTNLFHLRVHGPIAGLGTGEGNNELIRCQGNTAKGNTNDPWGKITSLVSYFEANGRAGVQAKFNAAQEVSIFIDDSGSMNIEDIGQERTGTGFTYAGTIKKLRDDIEATGRTIVGSIYNSKEDPICPFVTDNCCPEGVNSLTEACGAGSPCNPAAISFVKQPNNGLTREYCDNTYSIGSEFYGVCPQCISESEEEDQQTVEYTARISNSTGTSLDHELINYTLEYSDDSGQSWNVLRVLPDGYSNVEQVLNVADKSVDDCPQILRQGSSFGDAVNNFLDSVDHWCGNSDPRTPYQENQNFIPITTESDKDDILRTIANSGGDKIIQSFAKSAVSQTYRLVNGVKEWEVFVVAIKWWYTTTSISSATVDQVGIPYAKTKKFTVREDGTWALVHESELLIHREIYYVTADPFDRVGVFECINLDFDVSIDCGPLSTTSDSTYWAVGYSLFADLQDKPGNGINIQERVEWFGPTFGADGRPTTGRISTLEDDEYVEGQTPHAFGCNVSVPKFSLDDKDAPPYIVVSAHKKSSGRVFIYTMGLGGNASGGTVLQPIQSSREKIQSGSPGFLNNPQSPTADFGYDISQVRRLSRDFSWFVYHGSDLEDEQQNVHVMAIGAPNVDPNKRHSGAVFITHIYFNNVSGRWQFAPRQALLGYDALGSGTSTSNRYRSFGFSVELIDYPYPLLVASDPGFTDSWVNNNIVPQGAFTTFQIVDDNNRYWKCSNARYFRTENSPGPTGSPKFPAYYKMGKDISISISDDTSRPVIHMVRNYEKSVAGRISDYPREFISIEHIAGSYWSQPKYFNGFTLQNLTRPVPLQEYSTRYNPTLDPAITDTCLESYNDWIDWNWSAPSVDGFGRIYILPFYYQRDSYQIFETNTSFSPRESGFITLLGDTVGDSPPACDEFDYGGMGGICTNRIFRRLFRIRAKSESNPSLSVLSGRFQLYEIVRTGSDGYTGGVG